MTDREPDDLYDALRDRLADYGQEPPAPLWASIRAQLPPPVAAPKLRRRRRAAWLGTLLVLLSAGMLGWWWQAGRGSLRPGAGLANQAAGVSPASRPTNTGAGKQVQPRTTPLRPAAAGPAVASAGEAGRSVAPQPAAPASVAGKTIPWPANSPAILSAPTTTATVANAGSRRAGARPAGPGRLLAVGRAGSSRETQLAQARAASKSAPDRSRIAAAPALALAVETNAAARHPNKTITNQRVRPASETTSARTAADAGVGQVASPASAASSIAAARPAATRAASALGTRPTAGTSPEQPLRTAPDAPVLATAASQPAETTATAGGRITATAARAAWPPMALHAAALALAPAPAPTPLAPANTPPPVPVPAVRRWAVQALAGPALTSRTLGTERLSYASAPSNALPSSANSIRTVSATNSADNERATTGFGAEVQLQGQLNGRWRLGSGLGYQTFATQQTVNVRVVYRSTGPASSTTFKPDSLGTMSVRDTYHFLTLPLRVSYQLGTGTARLRYGLQAGADVAFYLGGRSTEGSGTGSISRGWGPSGSPYRPLSLALRLGADVRYQFAPGWELLAQPTLTSFVTSVARPSSGYVARYPLAATALVGVAWWLK